MPDETGFLSRWSRRKAQAKDGTAVPEEVPPAPVLPAVTADATAAPVPSEPAPTLADVHALTRESDYSRFVAGDVETRVKNAALKKLFNDPHFNVMDGLDTYIDDYGLPDPLPQALLRQMAQTQFLGLLAEPHVNPPVAAPAAPLEAPSDENLDLRLQPDDAARRPGPEPGAGEDPGREL